MNFFNLIFLFYPILTEKPEELFSYLNEVELNNSPKQQIQETIFNNNSILPFIILLFGCFILLYGAYNNIFLIIKVTLFLYYIFSIFVSNDDPNIIRNLLFILLASFMTAVLIYIAYKSNIKRINEYKYIKKLSFGIISGFFLNHLIFHYIYSFKQNYNKIIYYILFPILIIILELINILINIKISFIPCYSSVISGIFFIKLSIDNLLQLQLQLTFTEKIIDIVFCVIIAILSFVYQIYHLKRKNDEIPGLLTKVETTLEKNLNITKDSVEPQNYNNSNRESVRTNDEIDVTQDNNIDDQED